MLLIELKDSCRTLCLAYFSLGTTVFGLGTTVNTAVEKAAAQGANSFGECHSSGKTYDVQQNAPNDWVRLHLGEMRMV